MRSSYQNGHCGHGHVFRGIAHKTHTGAHRVRPCVLQASKRVRDQLVMACVQAQIMRVRVCVCDQWILCKHEIIVIIMDCKSDICKSNAE